MTSSLIAKLSLLVINFIICGGSFVYAQDQKSDALNLQIDYARFRVDENLSLFEVYYAVDRNSLAHEVTSRGLLAKYDVNIKIFYKDSMIKELHWQGSDLAAQKNDMKPGQMISDVHQLMLGSGNFLINVTLTDLVNQTQASKAIKVKSEPWPADKLVLSDLQIGLQAQKSDQKSRFTKNGYLIHPNPAQTYNAVWPIIYYYVEIYNLNTLKENSLSTYKLVAEIRDQQENILKTISEKTRSIDNFSDIIEVNKTLVSSLQSGFYEIYIKVSDENGEIKGSKSKWFYVYRPADELTAKADENAQKEDELRSLYLSKGESELNEEFEFISYIISGNEEDIYENLNIGGKREFFVNFWQSKAILASKDKIAVRQEYMDRVAYANTKYSASGKDGRRTEQGRVIIMYGIPDDIEKFYGGSRQKQHEIWTYDAIQGGVMFVFMDLTGYGIFRLVHSTVNEEIQDYEWQSRYLD